MAQMAFYIRFMSQIKRARPNLVPRINDMAVKAALESGGEITGGGGALRASFNENSPGFWLDMLFLIERLARIVEGATADLHGHAILLGETLPESCEGLCRFLSGGFHGGGVYLDEKTSEALKPYVTVEKQGNWANLAFFKLKEEKIFVSTARSGFLLPEKNIRLFEPGHRPSVLITGRVFEGRRDSLYRRVEGFSSSGAQGAEGFRLGPLFLRFGRGGLNALSDSWPLAMAMESEDPETWEKLMSMRKFLFRHRLRKDPSPFAIKMADEFFSALLALYAERARKEGAQPVVIIENIGLDERAASDVAVAALAARNEFILTGLCARDLSRAETEKWGQIFPRRFGASSEAPAQGIPSDLPADLWEMGYLCALVGRILPADLIPDALIEMGKNDGMISRSVSLMHVLRVIDTPLDPAPWHEDFAARAEEALGAEKTNSMRAFTRGRLFDWVSRKRLEPCVRLLEILAELGGSGEIDDGLILRAIYGELACSDGAALAAFAESENLRAVVGIARAQALRPVITALLALHFGGEEKIRDAFAAPTPECSAFPLIKTQALLNESLYHLGWHNGESATRTVKTATLLCQKSGHSWLSRCHRLFALASLAERRIGDTEEYMLFALENANKSGDSQEIGISSYYSAAAQFLRGNLSKSATLASKALSRFLDAGSPEWADRARFFEGRVAFETGRYDLAADIFQEVRDRPHGASSVEKSGLLDAWIFRSYVYAM
ncbi:MAG: hypothetical protein FWE09_01605, partial [Treponema sp.]|nr:hypothetical protein [Treponema sp.]